MYSAKEKLMVHIKVIKLIMQKISHLNNLAGNCYGEVMETFPQFTGGFVFF